MFKILVALSLFLAIQGQIGGFVDRPELVLDATTKLMVNLAVTELAKTQNLEVESADVFSVATQLVNGVNYRIGFTVQTSGSKSLLICSAKVYQSFNGQPSVNSVSCN